MRSEKLLAAFLLGVVLCFIPVLGYGEKLEETLRESKTSLMEHHLLRARVNYIMENPTNFLNVEFSMTHMGDGDSLCFLRLLIQRVRFV